MRKRLRGSPKIGEVGGVARHGGGLMIVDGTIAISRAGMVEHEDSGMKHRKDGSGVRT